jgi:hypothetical protein
VCAGKECAYARLPLAISAKRYALYTGDTSGRSQPVAVADGSDDTDDPTELLNLEADQPTPEREPALELVDRREHGLGHLLNPIDPKSDSRNWISQAWTYLEALARGQTPTPPDWFTLPAMSRITLSTPDLRRPFEAFNRERPYRDQIKPFNFLMRPQPNLSNTPAGAELPSLVAAYNDNPTAWLGTAYFDINDKAGHQWTITTQAVDPGEPHTIRVKTYGEVIAGYWDHEEAKSLAADGTPCRPDTRGLLRRRRIKLVQLQHIGKEGNKLEQREHGLVGSTADYLNTYDDPDNDLWTLYVSKALAAFTNAEIREASRRGPGPVLRPEVRETLDRAGKPTWANNDPMPRETIRDGRDRRPSPANERLITAAVVRLAAEALSRERVPVQSTAPGSPYVDKLPCLSLFFEDATLGRRCALHGCSRLARTRSRFCCEAHKKRARRASQ